MVSITSTGKWCRIQIWFRYEIPVRYGTRIIWLISHQHHHTDTCTHWAPFLPALETQKKFFWRPRENLNYLTLEQSVSKKRLKVIFFNTKNPEFHIIKNISSTFIKAGKFLAKTRYREPVADVQS
jgi:hypothetical protein